MIQNALERLKTEHPEVQQWWQEILDNPNFGLIIDAAKVLLEQQPPKTPLGMNPMEAFALAHSSNLGAKLALDSLELLGSAAMLQTRLADEKIRAGQTATSTAAAGTGHGRRSTPPPEVAPSAAAPQNG